MTKKTEKLQNFVVLVDNCKITNSFPLTRKSQLNKIIENADGSPDYLAINIYYDTLRSWYTPNKLKTPDGKVLGVAKLKTKGIYLNYEKLAKTHGCSKETIRKKLVKLEKLGLIQRSYQHKETVTTKSYNHLLVYVWKQTPYFYNKHGVDQSEVKELKPQTNHKYITKKYNIDYHSQIEQIKAIESKGGIHKLEDTKELIEPFSKEKDRSRTNFFKNSFDFFSDEENLSVESKNKSSENREEENKEISTTVETKSKQIPKLSADSNTNGFLGSGKYLDEMLEYLTDEVCNSLRANSGRNFTDRAIKEIAKAVSRSKKGAKAFFYHINGFISYLAKILSFEKRDPVKISSENYYIAANQTDEDKQIREQEKYLSEIEYSQQVSPEWHLKRKLAAMLKRDVAYNMLINWKQVDITKDGVARIILNKPIFLTETDKNIILNQVKATHERVGKHGDIETIEGIEFIFQEKKEQRLEKGESENLAAIQSQEEIKKLSIWLQVRKYFMDYCYNIEEGIGIDKNWLSKLTSFEDTNGKINTLNLKAESQFIKDWINSNYLLKLESIAKKLGYELFLQEG